MYVFDGVSPGLISNNSILLTDSFGQMPRLQCISATQMPHVGEWLNPTGQDITQSTSDPFNVIVGGENDPGYLDISLHSGRILTIQEQGVYTCRIPDESGVTAYFHIGIYLPALTSG